MANLGESRVDEKVERRVPKPLQLTAHCVFQVAILNGKIPSCHPRVHPNPPQISRHSTTQKLGRISFCTTLGCIPRCIPRESELQDSKCTFHVFAHTHTLHCEENFFFPFSLHDRSARVVNLFSSCSNFTKGTELQS